MNINLCFHGIGSCAEEREPGESRYWVPRDLFLRILDKLPGRPDVELSFDDGNQSDIEVAVPALLERGLRATFFPLAGRLKDPLSLNASGIAEIRNRGMTIGTHGWSHVPWRQLSDRDARRELVEAREALEKASGGPITAAALPLGRYDRGTLRSLRSLGYRVVYTSDRFPVRPTSWLQARFSVTADDTLETVQSTIEHRITARAARNALVSGIKRWRN